LFCSLLESLAIEIARKILVGNQLPNFVSLLSAFGNESHIYLGSQLNHLMNYAKFCTLQIKKTYKTFLPISPASKWSMLQEPQLFGGGGLMLGGAKNRQIVRTY
jgi:hypothetical protein